jgi:hypothetical protein
MVIFILDLYLELKYVICINIYTQPVYAVISLCACLTSSNKSSNTVVCCQLQENGIDCYALKALKFLID